jgi:hypothetical protein
VAEQLGEASLRIVVDDSALRQGLADAKALVERELGGTIRQQGQKATTGGKPPGGGTRGGITAEQRAASTILRLRNSINVLEANGVNVSRLRAQLSNIEAAAADRQFKAVNNQGETLRQIVSAEQNRLRVSNILTRNFKQQVSLNEKQSAAAVALNKQKQANFRQDVALAQGEAKFAEQYGPQPLKTPAATRQSSGLELAAQRRAQREQERAARQQIAEGLRIGRLNASPVRGGVAFPGSPIALEKAAAAERKLAREREAGAAATLKAAERERKASSNRRRDIAANALIGAGFPLLFGQGAGAAAGGAIGGGLGALGGGTFGFAGSIAGTALGAAFDTALEKGRQLAIGLEDPIKNFEALRQAALLSSRAVERNAEALIAAGREEEAAAIIRQDLLKTFGTTKGYEDFAKASDELNRSFSQATVALAQFVAGPLAEFLRTIATGLGGGAAVRFAQENAGRAREIIQANPAQGRRFRQLAQQRGLEIDENLAVNSRDLAARNKLVEEFLRLNGEQTAQQKQQAENEKEMNAAMASGNKLKELSARLALEQARGNELSAAQAERELIAAEKRTKLNLLPREATATQRRLVSESFTEREVANAERIRTAQEKINTAAFDEQQRRDAINASISNTISLLGVQNGEYRQTLQTIQSVQTSIDETRRKEAEIGFKIDQARLGGREEEAAQLVDRQRTASLETKQKLVEGAAALRQAGESIKENIQQATFSLQNLKLDNLRFLSPQERRETLAQLDRDFKQAQEERGVQVNIRGSREFVTREKRAFVEFARQEQSLTKAISEGNAALAAINNALLTKFDSFTVAVTGLAEATNALKDKNWNIDIQVVNQAGGASTVNAVNGLAQ